MCEAKGKMCVSLKDAGCNWQDMVPLDCLLLVSLAEGNPSIPDNYGPLVTSCAVFITDFV